MSEINLLKGGIVLTRKRTPSRPDDGSGAFSSTTSPAIATAMDYVFACVCS